MISENEDDKVITKERQRTNKKTLNDRKKRDAK